MGHPLRRQDRALEGRAALEGVLAEADCCHLALVDGTEPYLVTLNYGFVWQGELPVLYFHSAREGRKLDILRRSPRVCFSVDTGHELITAPSDCGWGMRYTSLVGWGSVTLVDDPTEARRGLDAVMTHYAGPRPFEYDPKVLGVTQVLRLEVTELSGKKKG